MFQIRTVEPGDGYRYQYFFETVIVPDGREQVIFGFGYYSEVISAFTFQPPAVGFVSWDYFNEKLGDFIRRGQAKYIAYLVFCTLYGQEPWGLSEGEVRATKGWQSQLNIEPVI